MGSRAGTSLEPSCGVATATEDPSAACKGPQPSHTPVSSLLAERKRQWSSREGRKRESHRLAPLWAVRSGEDPGSLQNTSQSHYDQSSSDALKSRSPNLTPSLGSPLSPKGEGSQAKANIPPTQHQKGLSRALLLSLSFES